MGYRVISRTPDGFVERRGLEGPFRYANGRVLYYDPRAGQYWDPRTDFYVPPKEVADLQQQMIDLITQS